MFISFNLNSPLCLGSTDVDSWALASFLKVIRVSPKGSRSMKFLPLSWTPPCPLDLNFASTPQVVPNLAWSPSSLLTSCVTWGNFLLWMPSPLPPPKAVWGLPEWLSYVNGAWQGTVAQWIKRSPNSSLPALLPCYPQSGLSLLPQDWLLEGRVLIRPLA